MRFMQQMAGKDEGTSLEDSSFGPGHFNFSTLCKDLLYNLYSNIPFKRPKINGTKVMQ